MMLEIAPTELKQNDETFESTAERIITDIFVASMRYQN